jgi:hypothetical protein
MEEVADYFGPIPVGSVTQIRRRARQEAEQETRDAGGRRAMGGPGARDDLDTRVRHQLRSTARHT